MPEQITYLIVGNGIAGITAAEVLRAEDTRASIGIITDDPFPVYYRPALKDYLGGRLLEEKLWARTRSFYQDQRLLLLPERVVGIRPGDHRLQLQSNKYVAYQKLLLANGASAARLQCPGCDLEGVTTLRTIADYQMVLQRLKTVKRVVVTGSGTLALETVETLRHNGVPVTHLLRRQTLWSEFLDATASDLVLQQERRDGVDVRLEEEIVEITGARGEVTGVVTSQGKRIACDLVLVAIGVEPNVDFIRASRIACGRGVRVDEGMRTNAPDIYAAGDLIETVEPVTGRTRVIGQWYPAIQQARAAAYSMLNLLDRAQPFRAHTFYNATFLYGLDFASVGMTQVPTSMTGYQELTADPEARTYRKVILKDGVAAGMLALGDRKRVLAFKRAIDHQVDLTPVSSQLFADDFQLQRWLDERGVPPALLGVKRAVAPKVASVASASVQKVSSLKKTSPQKNMIATQKYAAVSKEILVVEPDTSNIYNNADIPDNDHKIQEFDETMGNSQEALLVHMVDPNVHLRLAETILKRNEVVTVGRQEGVHMLVDEATVSRYHAEIRYINGAYLLRDLQSSNGTFVNGKRLEASQAYALQQNDEVRFGRYVTYRFLLRLLAPSGQTQLLNDRAAKPFEETMRVAAPPELDRALAGQQSDSISSTPATQAMPAEIIATLQKGPALVILPENASKEANRAPQVYLLKAGKHTTLGREVDNDVLLQDVVVSRHHAEVFSGPTGFYVHDMGSSNGVKVNQVRIENPYLLSHGDRIKMGSTTIFFIDMTNGKESKAKVGVSATKQLMAQSNSTSSTVAVQQTNASDKQVVCQRCGMVNMRVARFCASCSAPLH